MHRMPWPAYLWPGLPQLARDGSWAALAFAVLAGAMLNAVLLGTWFWTELFPPGTRIICWASLAAVWSGAAVYGAWTDRRQAGESEKSGGRVFENAQEDYLKGNWFEAERKLSLLLHRNEHDLEARLLMATLLRHTRRFDEATGQLNLLVRLDGAHRWALEIHREGELLTEARKSTIKSTDPEQENKPEQESKGEN